MAAARAAVKFGANLKEIRIHLCQKAPVSKGVRDFIENHYVGLKSSNPTVPILIRECSGVKPKLWVRYGFGHETSVSLDNFTSQQVLDAIHSAAQKTA